MKKNDEFSEPLEFHDVLFWILGALALYWMINH